MKATDLISIRVTFRGDRDLLARLATSKGSTVSQLLRSLIVAEAQRQGVEVTPTGHKRGRPRAA